MSSSDQPREDLLKSSSVKMSSLTAIQRSLSQACYDDDLPKAQAALDDWGAHTNIPGTDLTHYLNVAVSEGNPRIVRLLLEHGAVIQWPTSIAAAFDEKANDIEIFETLFEFGWNVNEADHWGSMPILGLVMIRPNADILVAWLLAHGALPDGHPLDPGEPLRNASSPNVASILLAHGATRENTSALHAAVYNENLPLIEFLIESGVDINERQYKGRKVLVQKDFQADHGTALHVAAKKGYLAPAKILVNAGANLRAKSKRGRTPRDTAEFCKKPEVQTLLEAVMRDKGVRF